MKQTIKAKNIKGMLKKEFKQLFRDKRMRVVLIVPPIMMLIVFAYAVNTDVNEVRIAVLDEDKTTESRDFTGRFVNSPYFRLYASIDSPSQAVKMLDRGEIDFYMQIKKNFSRNVKKGATAEVQVIIDGSDSSRASIIMSYVNIASMNYIRDRLKDRVKIALLARGSRGIIMPGTVEPEQRIFFNQDLKSKNFFLPGIIGLLITLITIMLTSMSIVKEKESGTIEQINVSPLHPLEYIIGKMGPFALVAFGDIFIISILAIFWFGVPFKGSFLFLLACGIIYIMSTLAIGLFISTISKTQQQAMLSSFLFFLPAILFSGFIFPVYSMPESIQMITYIIPLRYFMDIIRGIFLKGVGITVLWDDILLMLIIGISLLFLSVKRYHKRAE